MGECPADKLRVGDVAGIWPWAVPAAAIAAFVLAGVAARKGCACQRDTRYLGGAARRRWRLTDRRRR